MKNYKDVAEDVLKRRDEYLAAQKKRRSATIRMVTAALGFAAAACITFSVLKFGVFDEIKPSPDNTDYTVADHTAPVTDDITAAPANGDTETTPAPTGVLGEPQQSTTVSAVSTKIAAQTNAVTSTNKPTSTIVAVTSHPGITATAATSVQRRTTAATTGRMVPVVTTTRVEDEAPPYIDPGPPPPATEPGGDEGHPTPEPPPDEPIDIPHPIPIPTTTTTTTTTVVYTYQSDTYTTVSGYYF